MDGAFRTTLFWRSMRRRWWVIVLALLLGLGSGAFLVTTSDSEYRATSVIFLEPTVGNPYSPTTPSGRQEQLAALTTEAGLLLADSIARSVQVEADQSGVDLGPQIQERTSTEVPSNSQVINVSFTAASPEAAQFGAQALSEAYLEYRQARSEEVVAAQLTRIDEEISSLSALVDTASDALDKVEARATPESAAEIQILEEQVRLYANQLGQLRIERVSAEGAARSPGEVVSPASLPGHPEGLSAPLIAGAVVLVLLGSGVVLAVVLEHLDTRLRSKDEIEQLGLHPVYGLSPVWEPSLGGTAAEDSYRLATMSSRQGVHAVLGADGPVPAGVAAGLAHTLAEIGRSVVLVLATPVHRATGRYPGLSDALQRADELSVSDLYEARPGIHVLGAGESSMELPNLVHSPRFVELVQALAQQCDTLIIVGPEAVSATGAAVAHVADTTLLVCTAARTRESDLLASARMIQENGGALSGVLLSERLRRSRWRTGPETSPGWAGLAALLAVDAATVARDSSAGPRPAQPQLIPEPDP